MELIAKERKDQEKSQDCKTHFKNPATERQDDQTIGSLLLNVEELAAYLNLKPSKIRMMVFRKEVPYLKIGALVRFHRPTINAWLLQLSCANPPVVRQYQLFDSSILSNGSPHQRRSL